VFTNLRILLIFLFWF